MSISGRGSAILAVAVLIALIMLMLINLGTQDRISVARQQMLQETLSSVLPKGPFDQNPIESVRTHIVPELGGDQAMKLYTAYRNATPVAAVLELLAPDGYSGGIRMLLGLKADGSIIAARVIEHRETPGLGDRIEYRKSEWIVQFDKMSITGSTPADWQTRQSGGRYDALSGATITSRAIIQSIHRALRWFDIHRDEVFNR